MTKVVYTRPEGKGKRNRYIVQFRNTSRPGSDWIAYSETFHFKWAAILFSLLTKNDAGYEERVVDTRD